MEHLPALVGLHQGIIEFLWKKMQWLLEDFNQKGNIDDLLDALSDIDMKENDKYYIAFDYVVDNQDIRNKYRILKSIADM